MIQFGIRFLMILVFLNSQFGSISRVQPYYWLGMRPKLR